MKLYIYEHCPFCIRVRFFGQQLFSEQALSQQSSSQKTNLQFEEVVVEYHDSDTPMQLVGKRSLPFLVKDDNTAMAESLDIMAYFASLANSQESLLPSQDILDWQSAAFPLLQGIGYPRWPKLNLGEFNSAASKQMWLERKQTEDLNFAQLLTQTEQIASAVSEHLVKAEGLLALSDNQSPLPLIDQAIIFSFLLGFYCEPQINWPPAVEKWLLAKSESLNIPLLNRK